MISVGEAKMILRENIRSLPDEKLLVTESIGRTLSKDIIAPIDVPSFNNSAMDGYAFQYDEGKNHYEITTHIPAGDATKYVLQKGKAARIFTGAPIPAGADTVIQQELTTVQEGRLTISNHADFHKGVNIRLRGAQCKSGEVIIKSHTIITPGVIALLHSAGITEISVFQKPGVKVIVTGNELIEPGKSLPDGMIYNSNEASITAYLRLLGITDIKSVHIKDRPAELKHQISSSLKDSNVLILSGGISVGEYDFVYQTLLEEGVKPLFYKVKQKPGKPLFAGKKGEQLIFALPGNPAAAVTCFNQYIKPSLLSLSGHLDSFSCSTLLPIAHDWEKKTPLSNILKAQVKNGVVTILSGQDSFNLLPFADANAFVLLHENDKLKCKGELVETYYW